MLIFPPFHYFISFHSYFSLLLQNYILPFSYLIVIARFHGRISFLFSLHICCLSILLPFHYFIFFHSGIFLFFFLSIFYDIDYNFYSIFTPLVSSISFVSRATLFPFFNLSIIQSTIYSSSSSSLI